MIEQLSGEIARIQPIEMIDRTDVSMDYSGLTEQDTLERLFLVGQAYKAAIWWMIDGMRHMVLDLGIPYEQARDNTAQITGNEAHTVDEWWDVGEVFPDEQSRVIGLTFSHHKKVKAIKSPEARLSKLIEARDKGWGSDTLGATLSKRSNGSKAVAVEPLELEQGTEAPGNTKEPQTRTVEPTEDDTQDAFDEEPFCAGCVHLRNSLLKAQEEVTRLQGALAQIADSQKPKGNEISLSDEAMGMLKAELEYRRKASRGMDATLELDTVADAVVIAGCKKFKSDWGRPR